MARPRDPRPGPRPPRWTERLLSALLPWPYRDEALGDLREGFLRRMTDGRAHEARRWYRRQALRSVLPALRLRYQTRHDSHTLDGSMETLGQDIRYALRSLVKSPGFAVVSTITLALAIGVNTSIFSIVSVIVFADLPMQDSETVAIVRGVNAELGIDQGSVSPGDYMDLVERARSYESLSALTESQWVLSGEDRPVRVNGLQVTAGTFETWRLPPVLGRAFAEGEDRWGAERVAMLTHGYWQERFAGSPDVLGRTLVLDGFEHTIVGVTHPKLEFASFRSAQVVTPLILNRGEPNRTGRYLFVVGRLAPGLSHQMAEQEARTIGESLEDEYPGTNRGWALWSAPAMESLIDDDGNRILLLLQLTVGMVILIACANVANMLLARASARGRELAVRSALGAGRARIIRQLLTESLVISISAAVLGLGVAALLNRGLLWISAGTEVVFQMMSLDGRVLTFTLLVSLAAPLVFGLLPALRASALRPASTLRDGRSADGGRAGQRTRNGLVTAQVSLALTLMILATLLTRTVIALNTRPLGYDPSGLMTARITLPDAGYEDGASRLDFFRRAQEALASRTGAGAVELTSALPTVEFGRLRPVEVEGTVLPEGRAAPSVRFSTVSTGYFDVLGLTLEGGRSFSQLDDSTSYAVAVVSREVATQLWPTDDPVGRRFRVAADEEWLQVIGVVSDVRTGADSERPSRNVYVPHAQDPRGEMAFVFRTEAVAASTAGLLREAITSVDAGLPVESVRTMDRALYEFSASNFALLMLFVTFAVFALIMAAVGIYGVMAYSVAQRRNEIGLRMAIGAEVGSVRRMVVWQGTKLLLAGVGVGLLAALAMSRLLRSLVFGVSATDPLTFVAVPLLLGAVALAANLIPAMRATRLDPATTLRGD